MSKARRAMWIFLALLFLFTSIGYSVFVIFQIHSDNQQSAQAAAAQKASNQAQNNQTNTQSKGTKLQGTQLANYTPASSTGTLQSIDIKEGTGQAVKVGDTITANYTGAVAATGVIFQSSLDSGQPFTAQLSQGSLIQGWVDGIPGMKVGGTRRLIIPAAQAYGANPPSGSGIPANADLVFDIDLIAIK